MAPQAAWNHFLVKINSDTMVFKNLIKYDELVDMCRIKLIERIVVCDAFDKWYGNSPSEMAKILNPHSLHFHTRHNNPNFINAMKHIVTVIMKNAPTVRSNFITNTELVGLGGGGRNNKNFSFQNALLTCHCPVIDILDEIVSHIPNRYNGFDWDKFMSSLLHPTSFQNSRWLAVDVPSSAYLGPDYQPPPCPTGVKLILSSPIQHNFDPNMKISLDNIPLMYAEWHWSYFQLELDGRMVANIKQLNQTPFIFALLMADYDTTEILRYMVIDANGGMNSNKFDLDSNYQLIQMPELVDFPQVQDEDPDNDVDRANPRFIPPKAITPLQLSILKAVWDNRRRCRYSPSGFAILEDGYEYCAMTEAIIQCKIVQLLDPQMGSSP